MEYVSVIPQKCVSISINLENTEEAIKLTRTIFSSYLNILYLVMVIIFLLTDDSKTNSYEAEIRK